MKRARNPIAISDARLIPFRQNLRAELGYCPFCGKDAVCVCDDVIAALPVIKIDAYIAEYDAQTAMPADTDASPDTLSAGLQEAGYGCFGPM